MTGPIVVSGLPSDAELAALTAVLLSIPAAADQPDPEQPPARWGSPRDRLRVASRPGPDAWRTSLRH